MKNLVLLIFTMICGITSAQDKYQTTKPTSQNEQDSPTNIMLVKDVVIYPGCEQYEGNKRELLMCFSNELQKNILYFLDIEIPDVEIPQKNFNVQVQYVVNRHGEISQIEATKGDDAFKSQAISAVQKYADHLRKEGIKIQPAKTSTGESVALMFATTVSLINNEYAEEYIIYKYQQGEDINSIKSALKAEGLTVTEKRINKILKPYRKKKNRLR